MNYRDVYFSRVNFLGETTAERIKNGGMRSFQKWLAESPFTVRQLSVERGLYFDGIIETNKDKEYEKIMFLRVANDIPLKVGDIMNWEVEDGSTEKWLLLQKVKKTNGTYQTFWIVRCNYLMKWIDKQGHLQQSWSYFVSSLDSKIKGNYRTWNSLITPQPNKYAELLMPRYPIDRATNFIVEDESWTVVEYDHTSVPGTIYLSLTENKINSIYDDLKNNIADTDKLAKYELLIPENDYTYSIGDVINPVFTVAKNGIPIEEKVILLPNNKAVTRIIDGNLTAVGEGEDQIIVQLEKYPQIQKTIKVVVNGEKQVFSAYIDGPASLRLDREAVYVLKGTEEIQEQVIFSIDNIKYASISDIQQDRCTIHANEKNELGKIILSAEYANKIYTKEISIIPLW